jgi:competence protein ComEC
MSFSVVGLTSVINHVLPEPQAGLLAGLLFGTKAAIPSELYQALVATGTLHIIALSGANLSILANLVARTIRPAVGRRASSLLIIGLIVWFVFFVGPSPTIVRAAIMGIISLVGFLFGREYIGVFSWGIAVVLMLMVHVDWLFDISFELSALSTLGILLFGAPKIYPPGGNQISHTDTVFEAIQQADDDLSVRRNVQKYFKKTVKFLWDFFGDDLRLTLAAQVFTVPLVLFAFGRISIIAPLSNLAIGWIIGPLTGLGWATVVLGYIWSPLAIVVSWVDWVMLQYLTVMITFLSRIPGASIGL